MDNNHDFRFQCVLDGLGDASFELPHQPDGLCIQISLKGTPMESGMNKGMPRADTGLTIDPSNNCMTIEEFVAELEGFRSSIFDLCWETRSFWLFNTTNVAEITLTPALLTQIAQLRLHVLCTG